MSEKKQKHPLEARVGEPLHGAHVKRLQDAAVEHSKNTVANKIEYPDPESLSESDFCDPRDHALLPSVGSQRKVRRNKKRPHNETGAEGDQ